MSTVTTKDGIEIFYKDWGHGQPIVFHHGWPLSSDDWDTQMLFFVQQGTALSESTAADTGDRARCPTVTIWTTTRPTRPRSSSTSTSTTPFTSAIPRAAAKRPAMCTPRQRQGREVGTDGRRAAHHGQVAEQSGRPADRGVRRLPQKPGRQPRPVLSRGRVQARSTGSTDPGADHWMASSTTGGVKA